MTQQEEAYKSNGRVMPLVIPNINKADQEIVNKWYYYKKPIRINLLKMQLELTSEHVTDFDIKKKYKSFELRLPEAFLVINIEFDLIVMLLRAVNPEVEFNVLCDDDQALVLELLLSPVIEALEKKHSTRVVLAPCKKQYEISALSALTGAINVQGVESRFHCQFLIPETHMAFWSNAFDQQGGSSHISVLEENTSIPLSLNCGMIEFTLGTLNSLEAGDIILLGGQNSEMATMELSIGGLKVWSGIRDNVTGEVKITGKYTTISNIDIFDRNKQMSEKENDTTIDDIPVVAAFEVGRKDITVKQLREIEEGAIISFPSTDNEEVKIYVNGKVVGWGVLVKIDESIGVKIERIFVNGR